MQAALQICQPLCLQRAVQNNDFPNQGFKKKIHQHRPQLSGEKRIFVSTTLLFLMLFQFLPSPGILCSQEAEGPHSTRREGRPSSVCCQLICFFVSFGVFAGFLISFHSVLSLASQLLALLSEPSLMSFAQASPVRNHQNLDPGKEACNCWAAFHSFGTKRLWQSQTSGWTWSHFQGLPSLPQSPIFAPTTLIPCSSSVQEFKMVTTSEMNKIDPSQQLRWQWPVKPLWEILSLPSWSLQMFRYLVSVANGTCFLPNGRVLSQGASRHLASDKNARSEGSGSLPERTWNGKKTCPVCGNPKNEIRQTFAWCFLNSKTQRLSSFPYFQPRHAIQGFLFQRVVPLKRQKYLHSAEECAGSFQHARMYCCYMMDWGQLCPYFPRPVDSAQGVFNQHSDSVVLELSGPRNRDLGTWKCPTIKAAALCWLSSSASSWLFQKTPDFSL